MNITVITACLNAEETLQAAIESVRSQGESLHEYVVIDGGSTDGTLELIQAAEPGLAGRLKWISEPDSGIYDALNKGLDLSTGDFVLVLGADDVLLDGALARIAAAIERSPGADLVYGDAYIAAPGGATTLQRALESPRMVAGLPRTLPVCHQACAFSARAFDRLGHFDTSFRIAADYEFYLRFNAAQLASVRIPEPLVTYSLAGVSSRMARATADEYRRARVMHGMHPVRARLAMLRSVVNVTLLSGIRRVGG